MSHNAYIFDMTVILEKSVNLNHIAIVKSHNLQIFSENNVLCLLLFQFTGEKIRVMSWHCNHFPKYFLFVKYCMFKIRWNSNHRVWLTTVSIIENFKVNVRTLLSYFKYFVCCRLSTQMLHVSKWNLKFSRLAVIFWTVVVCVSTPSISKKISHDPLCVYVTSKHPHQFLTEHRPIICHRNH
jgi:hypothetical protein